MVTLFIRILLYSFTLQAFTGGLQRFAYSEFLGFRSHSKGLERWLSGKEYLFALVVVSVLSTHMMDL